MPTDNNTNLGFTPSFWLILRYAHGLYGKVLSRSRALSYSKNMTENLFTTENAEISDDFWKRRTQLYCMYYKRAFFIKALKYRRFGNDIVQSVSVIFHGAFRWLFFYNQKSFVRRRLRRCRLRHKIHAIKTIPNNPLRFLQHKNSTSLFGKRFNLCRSQNDVQNKKTFSQQTISTKIKSSTAWIRTHSFWHRV